VQDSMFFGKFLPPLLMPWLGVMPLNDPRNFWYPMLQSGHAIRWCKNIDGKLKAHTWVHEGYRRTDRRRDGIGVTIAEIHIVMFGHKNEYAFD